jgi:hypothetical protein
LNAAAVVKGIFGSSISARSITSANGAGSGRDLDVVPCPAQQLDQND